MKAYDIKQVPGGRVMCDAHGCENTFTWLIMCKHYGRKVSLRLCQMHRDELQEGKTKLAEYAPNK